MYIQIRKRKVASGDADQLCKQAVEKLGPILKEIPGFVDYLVVNNRDGYVMSINIFQDKTGVDESNRKAELWQRENAAQELPGPAEFIEGEIVDELGGYFKKLGKAA